MFQFYLPIYLSIHPLSCSLPCRLCVCVSFRHFSVLSLILPSVYPSPCLSVCLSIHPCDCLSVFPFIHLPVCMFVHPATRLSVFPSVCLSVCVCLLVCLSSCPSVQSFVCLSAYRLDFSSIHASNNFALQSPYRYILIAFFFLQQNLTAVLTPYKVSFNLACFIIVNGRIIRM